MSVRRELVDAISAWLNARSSRNLSMLARMSGMSYSTVRRSAQGEGETSQEAALAIGSLVMPDHVFRRFVGDNWPALKKFVLDVAYPQAGHEELTEYLRSPDHLDLLILASSGKGLTEGYLIQHYGQSRLPHLYELIDAGLLQSRHGHWVFEGQIGNPSRELTRKCLGELSKIFDKKNDEVVDASTAYLGWEGLNAEGAREISRLAAKFAYDASEILKDPSKRGDIVVVIGALHNILKGQEGLI